MRLLIQSPRKLLAMSAAKEFVSLNIAELTLSDTRNYENDTSGQTLVGRSRAQIN